MSPEESLSDGEVIFSFLEGEWFNTSAKKLLARVRIVTRLSNKLSPEQVDIIVSLRINTGNNVNTINIG